MRRVFYLFLIVFTSFSCTNKSGYQIKGTSDLQWLNGKKIYLTDLGNMNIADLDSAVVRNGKFTFKGVTDTAKFVGIWFFDEQNSQKVRRMLILENGNINIKIESAENIFVGGTVLNDIFSDYYNSITELDRQFDRVRQISEMDARKVGEEITQFNADFCAKNATNMIGKEIFLWNISSFSVEQKEKIIANFDVETKKNEQIKAIIKSIEQEKRVAIGQQFTDFALPTLQGDTLKLSDLVGKSDYLLVDFWASWCRPCIESLPALKSVYEKFSGNQFEILGVSLDDNRSNWQGAVARYNITWKHVLDTNEAAQIYAVNFIPTTILIDKNGKIVGRNLHIMEIEDILVNQEQRVRNKDNKIKN